MKKILTKLVIAGLLVFGISTTVQNVSANTRAIEPEYYYDISGYVQVGNDGWLDYIQYIYDYGDYIQLGYGYYNAFGLRNIQARYSCLPYQRIATCTFDATVSSGTRYYDRTASIQF